MIEVGIVPDKALAPCLFADVQNITESGQQMVIQFLEITAIEIEIAKNIPSLREVKDVKLHSPEGMAPRKRLSPEQSRIDKK